MSGSTERTSFTPARRVVRRALGARPWSEPLLLAFAPVFALLAAVTPATDVRQRWLWAALGLAAAAVALFSFAEQRRRVSFVQELCERRRELAMGAFIHEGSALQRDTPLRSYPIQASFLFVALQSSTCPARGPRPMALGLAVTMNLLLGWWSPLGLFRTPFCLWRCARGGDVTTPAQLIDVVDGYERALAERAPSVSIKVILLALLGLLALIGLALLVVVVTA